MTGLPLPAPGCDACAPSDSVIAELREKIGELQATVAHLERIVSRNSGLLEFCQDRQDDVLRFCSDTRIWPTNNISERGVRPLKTQQKISSRLTSGGVTQDRLDIRSYIDTARKQGQDVMAVLRSVMTGTP